MSKNNTRGYEEYDRRSRDTRTFMACQVISYNPDNCSVVLVPAYQERVLDEQNRSVSYSGMGEIIDVPVADVAGIRWIPNAGEHGVIFFHDVSIDNYLEAGAITTLDEQSRFHDYSDAVYFPFDFRCVNSTPPLFEIRDNKVSVLVDITMKANATVEGDLTVNGNTVIDGDTNISGDLDVDGSADISGDATIGNKSFLLHRHDTASGISDPPL